jgi:hypothetical protein
MLYRLVPRPVRRLWNEATVWRWCLILAVSSSGMILDAAPPLPKAPAAKPVAQQPQTASKAATIQQSPILPPPKPTETRPLLRGADLDKPSSTVPRFDPKTLDR